MIVSIAKVRAVLAAGAVLCVGFGVAASGQAGQPPASQRTQMDELLAEVRALRADLERSAAASMRGQLLGMRLQLQEQRIAAISRQLSDVQQRLRANAQARIALIGPLKMFANQKEGAGPENAEAMAAFLGPLKQQLAILDKADAELKIEESQLTGQLHDEQSRWTAFNGQIEEMERAAAGKAAR